MKYFGFKLAVNSCGGGIETWKYEINMQHLNISLIHVLCCKASANWVQQVPFS